MRPAAACPLGQQVIAPGDRGAQRLLPVRQVAAAAGQQAQRMIQPGRDRLQQPRHDRRARQQVLEVVQHDQDLPLAQLAHQVLHQRPVPGVLQPDVLGDRRRHQPRIPDRRQRDEIDAVRVVVGHRRGHGDAQPGLAAAARPGQRDQIAPRQQLFRLRQLAFPADEAGQRLRQADPPRRTTRDLRHTRSAFASQVNATRPAASR
jgi:hypothetical protein